MVAGPSAAYPCSYQQDLHVAGFLGRQAVLAGRSTRDACQCVVLPTQVPMPCCLHPHTQGRQDRALVQRTQLRSLDNYLCHVATQASI